MSAVGRGEYVEAAAIQIFGGDYATPLDLQPEQINIESIAHALSNQCRYSGHTREFYSVAEHCVHCVRVLKDESVEVRYAALLHDAAEAYLQDVARPLKEDPYFGKAYRGAEQRAEKVLSEVLGFIYPFPDAVKRADVMMLAAERRDLMHPNGKWAILEGVEVPEFSIPAWSPRKARDRFLGTFVGLENEMFAADVASSGGRFA